MKADDQLLLELLNPTFLFIGLYNKFCLYVATFIKEYRYVFKLFYEFMNFILNDMIMEPFKEITHKFTPKLSPFIFSFIYTNLNMVNQPTL
jgi:hypothetical protein